MELDADAVVPLSVGACRSIVRRGDGAYLHGGASVDTVAVFGRITALAGVARERVGPIANDHGAALLRWHLAASCPCCDAEARDPAALDAIAAAADGNGYLDVVVRRYVVDDGGGGAARLEHACAYCAAGGGAPPSAAFLVGCRVAASCAPRSRAFPAAADGPPALAVRSLRVEHDTAGVAAYRWLLAGGTPA